MSFTIHVVGAGAYRYARQVRHDGGEWEIGMVKARLISWSIGAARPSQSGGAPIVAASAGARVAALREFSDALTHLGAVGVDRLNISIRVQHMLWPTSGGNRTFFPASDASGTTAADICDFLSAHGMNRWAVLFQMNRALAAYPGGGMVNVILRD